MARTGAVEIQLEPEPDGLLAVAAREQWTELRLYGPDAIILGEGGDGQRANYSLKFLPSRIAEKLATLSTLTAEHCGIDAEGTRHESSC